MINKMLKKFFAVKKEKTPVFQVMLLDNDASQEVEVQESEQVDFARVQEHLAHGGSVFITSKGSQKIAPPKEKKAHRNRNGAKRITAFHLNHL
jgi:hypothetical protein